MEHVIYVATAILGMVATAIALKFLIPVLREYKIGQRILTEGPGWHIGKQGTPTMGGIAFGVVIPLISAIGMLIYAMYLGEVEHYSAIAVAVYALLCGGCGVVDDICKLKHKANNGLKAWQKYLLLLILTVGFLAFLNLVCGLETQLFVPILDTYVELGSWYWVFATVLLTGTVNAVNLTDGIDGLCGSVSAVVALFFFACALNASQSGIAILSAAAFGGCMGFLVFNLHPAKVFMGDTGSLFLGALLSGFAFALDIPIALFIVGIVYMIEAFSVIAQVLFFKLTGKRIFKMAPFHHHLEKCGWSEKRIVRVFTALSAVMSVVSAVLFMKNG
ncbi:MAG: phospho-N-acetylmuramoyl-pentapeptide-transferase [Clostridia bacterium]|nr:phospho-N-acetylmuramoyl-pentapeptide-transferase [Clostridia bacterium]